MNRLGCHPVLSSVLRRNGGTASGPVPEVTSSRHAISEAFALLRRSDVSGKVAGIVAPALSDDPATCTFDNAVTPARRGRTPVGCE